MDTPDNVLHFPGDDLQVQKSLLDLVSSTPTHAILESPTGSGKSYAAAARVIQRVNSGEPVLYAAANKVQLGEFASLVAKQLGFQGGTRDQCDEFLFDQGIVVKYHQGRSDGFDTGVSAGYIGPEDKFVLTHHSYLKPEGDGIQYAPFLADWWRKKLRPEVIIDEADHFITSTYTVTPLDQRYVKKSHKHDRPFHYASDSCPMQSNHRHQSCANCQLQPNALQWKSNRYGHLVLDVASTLRGVDEEKLLRNLDQFQHTDNAIRNGTFRLSLLKDGTRHFTTFDIAKRQESNQEHDAEAVIEELIKRAGMVALCTVHPLMDKEQVSPENIPTDRQERRQMDIVYPAQQCEARYLILQDMSPLVALERIASRVVFMSASFDDNVLKVINRGFHQDVPRHQVQPTQERKIRNLTVVLSPEPFSGYKHTDTIGTLVQHSRTLVFEPTQQVANKWSDSIETIPGSTIWNGGTFLQSVGGDLVGDITASNERHYRLVIAYANSAIARGINAPQYRTAIVDAGIHLPTIATKLDPENFTFDAINQAKRAVQTEKVKQCLGRILRWDTIWEDDGRRVVLLHNIPVENGQVQIPTDALGMLQSMADTVTVSWFKKSGDAVQAMTKHWQGEDIGGLTEPPLMDTDRYIKQRSREQFLADSINQRLQDWSQWITAGIRWTEFRRKSHLDRYRKRWGDERFTAAVKMLKADMKAMKLSDLSRETVLQYEGQFQNESCTGCTEK